MTAVKRDTLRYQVGRYPLTGTTDFDNQADNLGYYTPEVTYITKILTSQADNLGCYTPEVTKYFQI